MPEGLSRSTGEVTAGRAHVGHEGGVAAEEGPADDIGKAGRGVARGVQDLALDGANLKGIPLLEQAIELGPYQTRERGRYE